MKSDNPVSTRPRAEHPWLVALSIASLCVGISLSALNIFNWSSGHREQAMKIQKDLPRLRHFYIEISELAFNEGKEKETSLTDCPWVDTGFVDDGHSTGLPSGISRKLESKAWRDESVTGPPPSYFRRALNCLRIENNGGSAALNCTVEADVYDLGTGVANLTLIGVEDKRILSIENQTSERFTYQIGDIEPTKALLVPLFVGAAEDSSDSAYLAFGRILLPRAISYSDILGNRVRLEVRQEFYTPIRIEPYVFGKG